MDWPLAASTECCILHYTLVQIFESFYSQSTCFTSLEYAKLHTKCWLTLQLSQLTYMNLLWQTSGRHWDFWISWAKIGLFGMSRSCESTDLKSYLLQVTINPSFPFNFRAKSPFNLVLFVLIETLYLIPENTFHMFSWAKNIQMKRIMIAKFCWLKICSLMQLKY